MIRLYITPDDQQPYLLTFERAHINVGSAEANDVRLQALGISSRHFRLRRVGAEVVLEDGGSRNGTYVNGKKISGQQVLAPEDVIRIVGFRIKLLQPGTAGVAAGAVVAAPVARPAAVTAAPVAPRPTAPRPVASVVAPAPVAPVMSAQPVTPAQPVMPGATGPAVGSSAPRPVVAAPVPAAIEPAQEVDPPPGFDAARVAAIVTPRARAFAERADATQLLRGDELLDAVTWVSAGSKVAPAAGVKERVLVARSQQVGQHQGRRRLGVAAAFALAIVTGGWTARSVLAGGPDAHAAGFTRAVVKQFLAAHDLQMRRSCEDSSRELADAAMAEAKSSTEGALRKASEALQCVTNHDGMRDTAAERAVRSLLAASFSHVVERGATVRMTAADPEGRTFAWGHEDGTVMVWDFARAAATARDGAAAVELLAVVGRGDKLVALDASAQVRLWNLLDAEAAPQRFALDRSGTLGKAVASRDGAVLVVADAASTDLRVFPLATPGRVAGLALTGLTAATGALAVSDDGTRVFAASGTGVHGWRVSNGRRAEGPINYAGHELDVTALALATCGGSTPRYLLGGDAGGGVRLWDLKGKGSMSKPVKPTVLTGVVGGVVALRMTDDCRHVIAAGARSLRLWDLKSAEPDRTPRELQTGGPIAGVALDAGRAIVAAGSKLVVCDLGDGAGACQELSGHSKNVRSVDLATTTGWAITGGDDGTVRLWDTRASTGAASLQAHHPEPVRALALGDEGRVLSASGADAYLWRLRGAQPPEQQRHLAGQGGRPIKAVALSPNSTWAATAADEASLVLWHLAGDRPTSTVVASGSRLTKLAFSEDGAWLAGVGPQAACAVSMRGVGQPTCQPLPQAGELSALTFIPGGNLLAVGGTEREVVVVELDALARGTGSARQELGKGTGVVRVLAASPDGRWLAAGGEHADGRLWDLKAKGSPAQKLGGLVETVEALAFSPDGRWLAAGAGRKVFVWDLTAFTQPPAHVLEGPAGTVRALTFSTDGALLLCGGADGKLLAWPVDAMAAPPQSLGAQAGMITQLAALPGGGFAVSAGNDPTLHFWPLTARPLWELAQRVQGPAAPAP